MSSSRFAAPPPTGASERLEASRRSSASSTTRRRRCGRQRTGSKSSSSSRTFAFAALPSRSRLLFLLLLIVATPSTVVVVYARFLNSPIVQWTYQLPGTGTLIDPGLRRGNAVVRTRSGSRLYVTTDDGSLHRLTFDDLTNSEIESKVYEPEAAAGRYAECRSGVDVYEPDDDGSGRVEYVVYAVLDVPILRGGNEAGGVSSRIVAVNGDDHSHRWTISLPGYVSGTPRISSDGSRIYVVHNVPNVGTDLDPNLPPHRGKIKILQDGGRNGAGGGGEGGTVTVIAALHQRNRFGPYGPLTLVHDVKLEGNTTGDVAFFAESWSGGYEEKGRIYALRPSFDATTQNDMDGRYELRTLSHWALSSATRPAVSRDGKYLWIGAVGGRISGFDGGNDDVEGIVRRTLLDDARTPVSPSWTIVGQESNRNRTQPVLNAPAVMRDGNRILLAGNANDFLCVDKDDADVRWRDSHSDSATLNEAKLSEIPGAAPRVYSIESLTGKVREHDAYTGERKWDFDCVNLTGMPSCADGVEAEFDVSANGNVLYYGDVFGKIVALRVASYATSAPVSPPTETPSEAPTVRPSDAPTPSPSRAPSGEPSGSTEPSVAPMSSPTTSPTVAPSLIPTSTRAPSIGPTKTIDPTNAPTDTAAPSSAPSDRPTGSPSDMPSSKPTPMPSAYPSEVPSDVPTTLHLLTSVRENVTFVIERPPDDLSLPEGINYDSLLDAALQTLSNLCVEDGRSSDCYRTELPEFPEGRNAVRIDWPKSSSSSPSSRNRRLGETTREAIPYLVKCDTGERCVTIKFDDGSTSFGARGEGVASAAAADEQTDGDGDSGGASAAAAVAASAAAGTIVVVVLAAGGLFVLRRRRHRSKEKDRQREEDERRMRSDEWEEGCCEAAEARSLREASSAVPLKGDDDDEAFTPRKGIVGEGASAKRKGTPDTECSSTDERDDDGDDRTPVASVLEDSSLTCDDFSRTRSDLWSDVVDSSSDDDDNDNDGNNGDERSFIESVGSGEPVSRAISSLLRATMESRKRKKKRRGGGEGEVDDDEVERRRSSSPFSPPPPGAIVGAPPSTSSKEGGAEEGELESSLPPPPPPVGRSRRGSRRGRHETPVAFDDDASAIAMSSSREESFSRVGTTRGGNDDGGGADFSRDAYSRSYFASSPPPSPPSPSPPPSPPLPRPGGARRDDRGGLGISYDTEGGSRHIPLTPRSKKRWASRRSDRTSHVVDHGDADAVDGGTKEECSSSLDVENDIPAIIPKRRTVSGWQPDGEFEVDLELYRSSTMGED